jgi:hypothetical protein
MTAGMLLARQGAERSTEFQALAQETALIVRQAQTYGAGGRFNAGGGYDKYVYGIKLATAQSENQTVYLYRETTAGAQTYDAGDEIETYQLPEDYTVDSFCVTESNDCNSGVVVDSSTTDRLSLVFERPSPVVNAYYGTGSGSWTDASGWNQIIVTIINDGGSEKKLTIGKAGYIYAN